MKPLPRPTIQSLDGQLTFGKYKNWTIDQVLDTEPGYISWCVEQRIFVLDDEADEALLQALERFRKERV